MNSPRQNLAENGTDLFLVQLFLDDHLLIVRVQFRFAVSFTFPIRLFSYHLAILRAHFSALDFHFAGVVLQKDSLVHLLHFFVKCFGDSNVEFENVRPRLVPNVKQILEMNSVFNRCVITLRE